MLLHVVLATGIPIWNNSITAAGRGGPVPSEEHPCQERPGGGRDPVPTESPEAGAGGPSLSQHAFNDSGTHASGLPQGLLVLAREQCALEQ